MSADGDIVREALRREPFARSQVHEAALAALACLETAEEERDNWRASNHAERQARLAAEAQRDALAAYLEELDAATAAVLADMNAGRG